MTLPPLILDLQETIRQEDASSHFTTQDYASIGGVISYDVEDVFRKVLKEQEEQKESVFTQKVFELQKLPFDLRTLIASSIFTGEDFDILDDYQTLTAWCSYGDRKVCEGDEVWKSSFFRAFGLQSSSEYFRELGLQSFKYVFDKAVRELNMLKPGDRKAWNKNAKWMRPTMDGVLYLLHGYDGMDVLKEVLEARGAKEERCMLVQIAAYHIEFDRADTFFHSDPSEYVDISNDYVPLSEFTVHHNDSTEFQWNRAKTSIQRITDSHWVSLLGIALGAQSRWKMDLKGRIDEGLTKIFHSWWGLIRHLDLRMLIAFFSGAINVTDWSKFTQFWKFRLRSPPYVMSVYHLLDYAKSAYSEVDTNANVFVDACGRQRKGVSDPPLLYALYNTTEREILSLMKNNAKVTSDMVTEFNEFKLFADEMRKKDPKLWLDTFPKFSPHYLEFIMKKIEQAVQES